VRGSSGQEAEVTFTAFAIGIALGFCLKATLNVIMDGRADRNYERD
jgi:hypothetical protein